MGDQDMGGAGGVVSGIGIVSDPPHGIALKDRMPKVCQLIDELRCLVAGHLCDEASKAAGGNKSAGTRVRQVMQVVKEKAQEIRKEIIRLRNEDVNSGKS